jgi:hypothetical protein
MAIGYTVLLVAKGSAHLRRLGIGVFPNPRTATSDRSDHVYEIIVTSDATVTIS